MANFSISLSCLTALLLTACSCNKSGQEQTATVETERQKMSYALGVQAGRGLRAQALEVDHPAYMRGLKEGAADQVTVPLPQLEEGTNLIAKFRNDDLQRSITEARRAADVFLEKNGRVEGVGEIEPGIQLKYIERPEGPTIGELKIQSKRPEELKIKFERVIKGFDGKVFESYPQGGGEPQLVNLSDQLPSVQKALDRATKGTVAEIYLAPDKAFGNTVRPGIPQGAGLVMQYKILEISN